MARPIAAASVISTCLWGVACALPASPYQPAPTESLSRLPPPPGDSGVVELTVVYPPAGLPVAHPGEHLVVATDSGYRIQSGDSTFVFGSAGRGDARVTVNGQPVAVYPTGGWLAWLALPNDTIARWEIVAAAGSDTAAIDLVAAVTAPFSPPPLPVWIDTTSLSPRGDLWTRPGEGMRLSLRASPDASVRGLLSQGGSIEFVPGTTAGTYVAWWPKALGPDAGPVLAPDPIPEPSDTAWMVVIAVVGADTARARWPLRVTQIDLDSLSVIEIDDDLAGEGTTDGILAGRPTPLGTYHWFFPNGTTAPVSGRNNSQVRLQLSRGSAAWVDVTGVEPLPAGTPPNLGTVLSPRLQPHDESVVLRIPLPGRIPFRVDEDARDLRLTLYGVAADMDWIHYGGTDPLVRLITFSQPREDETVVTVSLSTEVWGYRTRWDGGDLLFEVRRPPQINPRLPLAAQVIALDAGHPPLGATGPTGVREPDVTLSVARKAAEILERYGAQVVLTRDSDGPLDLYQRTRAAEAADAQVLVSIHANALPDGVNPFRNNGTSVFYFHPRSVELARELNRALVRQLGFPDLGIGRGDLALARPTWMPAALTEGLFLMIPEQEAVLASEEGQLRYARGIVEGIAAFLRQRSLSGT